MADDNVQALIAELGLNLRKIEGQQRRLVNSFDKAFSDVEKGGDRRLAAVERRAEQMSRNVRRAIAAIALGVAGREVTAYADAWVDLNNKVKAAGEVSGIQGRGMHALAADARSARSEIEPYVDLYSRILRAGKGVAQSEAEVARVTQITAKAFAAGGAGASEQAAGVLQLGQALGSGFLQGDELRSLRENAPLVAKAIADAMGVSIGQLKALGAEGKITSEVVFRALLDAEQSINGAFNVTVPRASAAAVLAFDNLKLKVGEFLVEGGQVASVSEAAAAAINFVADNLSAFADAIIVGSAALAGFYGAQGLMAAAKGLQSVAVGATAAARATAILNATMAFFGGPIPLAIAAVAAGIAYIAINAGKSQTPLEQTRDKLEKIGAHLDALDEILPEPFAGMAAGAEAADDKLAPLLETIRKLREGMEATGKAGRQMEIDNVTIDIIELGSEIGKTQKHLAALRALADTPVQAFGGRESATQAREQIAEVSKALDDLNAAMTRAEEKRKALLTAPDSTFAPDKPPGDKPGDPDKTALAAIEAIGAAHLKEFETERERIVRIRDEQLAAIAAAGLAGEAATAKKLQVEELYQKALTDLQGKEFDAFVERQTAKWEAEQELHAAVMRARDEQLGHSVTIMEQEYEAQKARIEATITDQTLKGEALAALDEDYADKREEIEQQIFGAAQTRKDAAVALQAAEFEEKLALLEDWYANNLEKEAEYLEQKAELTQENEDKVAEIKRLAMAAEAANSAQKYGQMADQAKDFFGKQSGIYKGLFAAQKAFAIADAAMRVPSIFMKTMDETPGPYPIRLAAAVLASASALAQAAKIKGANYARGVIGLKGPGTATSDDIPANLSRGESVITARGTQLNARLLSRINAGEDIEGSLARAGAPGVLAVAAGAAGGSRISVGGSVINFNGPVDQAAVPDIDALMTRRDEQLAGLIGDLIRDDRTRTTARHLRGGGFLRG